MTHVQSIIAAMQTIIIAANTPAGSKVRIDTADPYSFEDAPAVVIDCGDEVLSQANLVGFAYYDLTVNVWIIGTGAAPKMAAEPTRGAAHAALYADRTMGGVCSDITLQQVSRQIDADNPAAGITNATYKITYRAAEATV